MQRVLVSDIFGLTDELIELGEKAFGECLIIDPYMGEKNKFTDETSAYQYFTNNVGLEAYSSLVLEKLLSISGEISVIAFSVGASAMWMLSERLSPERIAMAHLFYGSQIRNMPDIRPNFQLSIVLPRMEDHFSVKDMAEFLESIDNVSLEQSLGLHGFMNRLSRNFNKSEYESYSSRLREYAI